MPAVNVLSNPVSGERLTRVTVDFFLRPPLNTVVQCLGGGRQGESVLILHGTVVKNGLCVLRLEQRRHVRDQRFFTFGCENHLKTRQQLQSKADTAKQNTAKSMYPVLLEKTSTKARAARMSGYHWYTDQCLGTSGWTPFRVRWVPRSTQKKASRKKLRVAC